MKRLLYAVLIFSLIFIIGFVTIMHVGAATYPILPLKSPRSVPASKISYGPIRPSEQPYIANSANLDRVYTSTEIAEMTAQTVHPYYLRKLIACESQNTNLYRPDSNGAISFGILQFNGTSTWDEYAPLAGVKDGSPLNPVQAIKVADYMISIGQLRRWTCARIQKLL